MTIASGFTQTNHENHVRRIRFASRLPWSKEAAKPEVRISPLLLSQEQEMAPKCVSLTVSEVRSLPL